MSKYKVGMVSLGCDKNRVDSELILGAINKHYEITNDAKEADIIIVNTCGFIESAKQESIDTILEMAEYKNKYNCKMLIATGCLTQRYGDELLELIPEIDILMGVNDYMKLHRLILDFIKDHKRISSAAYSDEGVNEGIRLLTTKQHTAYVRIAEGCNNFCTYCIIPKIRGKFRSRLEKNILDEVNLLVNNGVKEIILIAQDLTDYGVDIYGKRMLHDLVRKISLIDGVEWIRLLYCYPEEITDELIEEIANNDKVVKYLDLPIQHISSKVLKQMGRRTNKETIIDKIETLRNKVPNIALRTSLIVGFPGETEGDFNKLYEFVKKGYFDKLGVFTYSKEDGTPAARLKEQIHPATKKKRYNLIMSVAKDISAEKLKSYIGKEYKVLVEDTTFDHKFCVGRSYMDIPDTDGMVIIKDCDAKLVGEFVNCKVTAVNNYDLIAKISNK